MFNTSTTRTPSNGWVSVSVGKTITAVVMFVTVLIFILLPIFIVNRLDLNQKQTFFKNSFRKWVGRLSCFAAGVFLSTGFLDIFPDVIEAINEAGKKLQIKISFPLASFFTLLGFFMILSIEQLIFIYNESIKNTAPKCQPDKGHSNRIVRNESNETLMTNDVDIEDLMTGDSQRIGKTKKRSQSIDSDLQDHEHFPHNNGNEDIHNNNNNEHDNILHHNKSRIIALMSAISVHAVFEGFAIGLSTTIAGVTQLFLALSLHKLIIAGSLGLNLATAKLSLWFKIIVGLIFSLGSPLGIVAGIGVMKMESNGINAFYMVGGALEGVACGTFLYVVFFEILPHEMGHNSKEDRGGKLTGLITGFILVCVYILCMPEN